MTSPREILDLVERFRNNRQTYQRSVYNETQVRREFLDPFFKALGWDIANEQGHSQLYQDVIHEDRLRVGGTLKAPDYAFRVGGRRKFFVEAKKPTLDLAHDPSPAYQLRRYAWSAKLPLSILTDFQEFAVYDCRQRPDPKDSASVSRVLYLTFEQYVDQWDDIAAVFSKDAVLRGGFDSYAAQVVDRRGALEVDRAFLAEVESWRASLAKRFKASNPNLTQKQLNYVVQMTIDRIVFLRICEDRGIEPHGQLRDVANNSNTYEQLIRLYQRADERYNSGLFHFRRERGREEEPDSLSLHLTLPDRSIDSILETLYYPRSPYEFSVLPTEILGQVYEQFLGRVIRLVGNRVFIEYKPEVRKAGGVYYTPTYIVDYIVAGTLGVLLSDKTPRQAGGEKKSGLARPIRVVDPACGSGSFLLGAYQYLLDWYTDSYVRDDPDKWATGRSPRLYLGKGGIWRLTTGERKRILLTHIYGVDIDPQAVEVTKLSLLLKVLEGESAETLQKQLQLFQERALPDLGANIKCGNSLVGPDFYDSWQGSLLGDELLDAVNPFDWETELSTVFADGGFDVVIGNPPYLSYSGRQAIELPAAVNSYYSSHYSTEGWRTSHSLFIERALRDISSRFVAFIVPDQVGHLRGYGGIRSLVSNQSHLASVRYWGEHVFENVTTPALTFVADRQHEGPTSLYDINAEEPEFADLMGNAPWSASPEGALFAKIHDNAGSLGQLVADPGVHTGNCSKKLILPIDEDAVRDAVPVLEGKEVSRYRCTPPRKALRLRYRAKEGEYFTIRLVEKYRNAEFVVRQTAAYPIVGPRRHADYFRNSLLALYSPDNGTDVRYLVGLLNSRLLRYAYESAVRESRQKAFPQVKVKSLRALPIRWMDLRREPDRKRHDRMVSLVQQMLDLHQYLDATSATPDRTMIRRRILATDRQIDALVYDIYDLTEEEISKVEAAEGAEI